MGTPLNVLLLEDHPPDAELIIRALRRGGYDPSWTRVTTEEEFVAALGSSPPEVILADSSMPVFSMVRALALVREHGLNIPVISVSGRQREEAAAECLELGAADYVPKDDLGVLPGAVKRAISR